MTPTPDTTARTETAETVTVPRALALQADKLVAEAAFSDEDTQAAFDWIDDATPVLRALAAAPALASPQHAVGVREALEQTGCRDEADLIDMANVGVSLMKRIESLNFDGSPYWGWAPADDPAEIVTDLFNDLEEARAAHPPAQDAPGAVKVKALEWQEGDEGTTERAATPIGEYAVKYDCWGGRYAWCPQLNGRNFSGTSFPSKDEAKAAAQADFARRILAALDPSPPLPKELKS